MLNPNKQKIKRTPVIPVNCELCGKFISKENGKVKVFQRFNNIEEYVFNALRTARAFKVLPKAGGYDDQNPEIMEILLFLNDIQDRSREVDSKNFQMSLVSASFGRGL